MQVWSDMKTRFFSVIKSRHYAQNLAVFLLCLVFFSFFVFEKPLHRILFYLSLLTSAFIFSHIHWFRSIKENRFLTSCLGAYIGFNILSLLWSSPNGIEDQLQILKYLSFSVLFIACIISIYKLNKSYLDAILASFIFGAFISSLILLAINIPELLTHSDSDRAFTLYGLGRAKNPNECALLYSIALITLIFYKPFYSDSLVWKYLSKTGSIALMSMLFATIIILTGSRNGLVSIIGVLIISAIFKYHKTMKDKRVLIFIGLIFIITLTYALTDPSRIQHYLERADAQRFSLWSQAIEYFFQAPFLGHGAASELTYLGKGRDFTAAHNIYLGHLNTLGLLGSIIFLSLACVSLVSSFKIFKQNDFYYPFILLIHGGIWGCFAGQTYVMNLSPAWLSSWFPLALILSMTAQTKDTYEHR